MIHLLSGRAGRAAVVATAGALALAGVAWQWPRGHPTPPRSAAPPTASFPAATPSPAPRGSTVDWAATVRAENARPGSRDWRVPRGRGAAEGLDDYTGQVSVRPGE